MSEWKKVKIGDVCKIIKGTTGIASAEPGDYPLVVTAVDRKTCSTYQFDCDAVCIPLVSSSGHGKKSLNNVHFQSGKFALGTILCAVIPNNPEELDARYLHQYLQFYKDTALVPLMKGAANVSLSMKDIATVEFPMPSIEQQRSLSNLFVSVQEKQKEFSAEFEKQTEYAKLLRQNILQDAIEGKLTADWRKTHPVIQGDPDYDAEALFEKIREEKCHTDSILLTQNQKKRKNGKSLDFPNPCDNEDLPFEIPEGWKWVRVADTCIIKGWKRVANGYKLLTTPTPYIYIRVSDMKNGTIDDSDLHYIDETMYQQIKRYIITSNDLYMTIVGATIGKCGVVPEKFNGMNLTENAARLIPFIDKLYLLNCLTSAFLQNQFIEKTKQVAVQKMALNRFSSSILPLPPLAEQKEIVNRVETMLAKVSGLEKEIEERKMLSDKLLFGIIKEKLEG